MITNGIELTIRNTVQSDLQKLQEQEENSCNLILHQMDEHVLESASIQKIRCILLVLQGIFSASTMGCCVGVIHRFTTINIDMYVTESLVSLGGSLVFVVGVLSCFCAGIVEQLRLRNSHRNVEGSCEKAKDSILEFRNQMQVPLEKFNESAKTEFEKLACTAVNAKSYYERTCAYDAVGNLRENQKMEIAKKQLSSDLLVIILLIATPLISCLGVTCTAAAYRETGFMIGSIGAIALSAISFELFLGYIACKKRARALEEVTKTTNDSIQTVVFDGELTSIGFSAKSLSDYYKEDPSVNAMFLRQRKDKLYQLVRNIVLLPWDKKSRDDFEYRDEETEGCLFSREARREAKCVVDNEKASEQSLWEKREVTQEEGLNATSS